MRIPYFLLFTCFLVACTKKDNDSKPTRSQNGSNRMYYEINGAQHYITGGEPGMLGLAGQGTWAYTYTDYKKKNWIAINSINRKNVIYDDVDFTIKDSPKINTPYRLGSSETDYRDCVYKGNGTENYYTDSTQSFVTITRFNATIIAGTFVLRGVTDSGEVIQLNNGWFDIAR